jgi:hypothetical protein
MLLQNVGSAQIDIILSTDKDTISAGESVLLTLDIRTKNPQNIAKLDFIPFQKIENIVYDSSFFDQYLEVAFVNNDGWPINKNDGIVPENEFQWQDNNGIFQLKKVFKIAIYNFGMGILPAPQFILKSEEKINTFERPIIAIAPYENAVQDTVMVAPNKPNFEEPTTLEDFYPLIIGLISLLILAALYYYFSKKVKKQEEEIVVEEEIIVIPAHIKAIKALSLLENKTLWQQGKVKEYQSELTHIIREYLEDRYSINALELTTSEISKELKNKDFDKKYSNELNEILMVADLVKFAKSTPDISVHDQFMAKAKDFVENTKLTIREE